MKINNGMLFKLAATAVCLGFVCACLLAMPSQSLAKKKEITFGAASPVGGYMLLATGIARAVNTRFGNEYNVTPVPEPRGSLGNVKAINSRERELGLGIANMAYNGYMGLEPFKQKQGVKAWFAAHYAIWNVIALESSGIKKMSDLKGKKVVIGKPRGVNQIMNGTLLLKAHGVSFDDIKPEMVGLKEAVSLMKDKHVDALCMLAAPPLASFSELSMAREVRFIPPDPKALAEIIKQAPFFYQSELLKSSYPKMIMPDKLPAVAINHVVMCADDLPNEMMYKFTKAVFEQIDMVHSVRKSFSIINLQRAAKGLPIPIHPGALKYFKEKGVN
jgi:TRAP transporter TAXI family solute receptor